MTFHCLLLRASSLPEGDAWTGSQEQKVLASLDKPKRRADWKLGRYAAKTMLASVLGVDDLERIEVIAADDGAPDAYVDGEKLDLSISITHRRGIAACVLSADATVGCDLEAIEPRTTRFVRDFFTERERMKAEIAAGDLRELRIALTWSAKESALKVLRVGLRRDTRNVEVELEQVDSTDSEWHPLAATIRPEENLLGGWWRREDDMVLSVVSDGPSPTPPAILEPEDAR